MGSSKFDIEMFSGKNDFGLWRMKVRAILVQQGVAEALKGKEELTYSLSSKEKM